MEKFFWCSQRIDVKARLQCCSENTFDDNNNTSTTTSNNNTFNNSNNDNDDVDGDNNIIIIITRGPWATMAHSVNSYKGLIQHLRASICPGNKSN